MERVPGWKQTIFTEHRGISSRAWHAGEKGAGDLHEFSRSHVDGMYALLGRAARVPAASSSLLASEASPGSWNSSASVDDHAVLARGLDPRATEDCAAMAG